MSRVSIRELYNDIRSDECSVDDMLSIRNIEVVPRKMVERIIEECVRNEITNYKYGNYCAAENLKHIREYAESLLKQFEEGTDESIQEM